MQLSLSLCLLLLQFHCFIVGLLCDLEAILKGRITWRCMHVQLISLLIGVLENFATKCRVRVFSKKQSPRVLYLKSKRANMYKKQNV